MPLTDMKIKALAARDKQYKVADAEGLYLLVTPSGGKYWRMKMRYAGKEKVLSFGVYPKVTLAEARKKRMEAKLLLAEGKDPSRPVARGVYTMQSAITDFMQERRSTVVRGTWMRDSNIFSSHIIPEIGHLRPDMLSAMDVIAMGRAVEAKGVADTANRCISMVAQVMKWLMIRGVVSANPAAGMSSVVIKPRTKHHPHLSERELPAFLRAVDAYTGDPVIKMATQFLLLTFVRTGEMRHATWQEIDMERAQWKIPAERMKMRRPHIVPLSKQALAILEAARAYDVGTYVFPGAARRGNMSENAVLNLIEAIGYKGRITGHGFRGTASTILNERGYAPDVIERQLAHVSSSNSVRAAYNHAQYLPQRSEMMQAWADLLDDLATLQSEAFSSG